MTDNAEEQKRQRYTLLCGRLVTDFAEHAHHIVTVAGQQIAAVGTTGSNEASGPTIDLRDAIVTPGFIDVHTHGGGGFSLHTAEPDEIRAYARWAPSTGTTAFLAGTVGIAGGPPLEQARAVVTAIETDAPTNGAETLGIHLEGPYINVARRGAHEPAWLRMPNEDETEAFLELAHGYLRLITIAPELPGALAMIDRLVAAGVTVSIGHTDSDYEQARAAIGHGITHATHCLMPCDPYCIANPVHSARSLRRPRCAAN